MSDITKHQGDNLPKKQRTLGEALNDLVHDLHGVERGSHYLQEAKLSPGVTLGPEKGTFEEVKIDQFKQIEFTPKRITAHWGPPPLFEFYGLLQPNQKTIDVSHEEVKENGLEAHVIEIDDKETPAFETWEEHGYRFLNPCRP